MNEEKTLTISLWKAISVFALAIVGTSVATAFSVVSTLNSDHFILARAVEDIDSLEGRVVITAELEPRLINLERDLAEIKQDVKEIRSLLSK